MTNLPVGTVTFLFTDIQGSTRLAREYPESWETARARHHAILSEAIKSSSGFVFQIIGDAFCAAFNKPGDAIKAALKAQRNLQSESWGEATICVRMGIHTGDAETDGKDYRGYLTLSLVERIVSAGHGGQILVSNATESLLRGQLPKDVSLHDLGEHRLKDVPHPTRIFQVTVPDLQRDFPALRALDIFPGNLPTQLTSFIGREKELADVKRLLHNAHMLTLIGPGGTGKTRLSIQAAGESLTGYPDGIWLVELAPVLDPTLVPRTTAIAIGLRDEPQRPVIDMLCDYLHEKKMLLLLDNCEHLVDACAQMAERILRAAPNVRILVSSREALGIAGEVTYRVPSLGLPDVDHLPAIEALSQFEAVKLFIDRATSAVPTFTVTNDNAPSLAQICHRLDGIPLAIELAAAKVRVLSMEQIAKRLDDRFRLLTGGSRTALERHQTLRAALDWSYNLLPPAEQILFRRLSVFVGGWTLEAAELVCQDESASGGVRSEDVLSLLEGLINKSLVSAEEARGESRYRALETMRQYANEKLVESGESDSLRDKHLDYFLSLAETAEPHLRRTEQIEWLARLDPEIENLRAALSWAMGKPSALFVLRLAGALGMFWDLRAFWIEGAKWMDQALGREWDESDKAEKVARGKVCYCRAVLADQLDEESAMKTSVESAVVLCEQVGDAWGSAYSRALLADYRMRWVDATGTDALLQTSLNEFREMGDLWGEGLVMALLARFYMLTKGMEKEFNEVRQKRIALARQSGDRYSLVQGLNGQGMTHVFHGEWDQAEAALREAGQLLAKLNLPIGNTQLWRAFLFFGRGELEKARTELEAYVEWGERVGERNMRGMAVYVLGSVAEMQGDLQTTLAKTQRSLELARQVGSQLSLLASLLAALGRLKYLVGERESAFQLVNESMDMIKQNFTSLDRVSFAFLQIAGMFIEKSPRTTIELLGYSDRICEAMPLPRNPVYEQPYFDRFFAAARAKLGEAEFASAWEEGLKMTQEEAVELTLKALEEL